MADNTKLDYAGATLNPPRARNLKTGAVGHFCVHTSPGCELCYSEAWNRRLGVRVAFAQQNLDQVEIFLDEAMLEQPLHWRRPRRIFLGDMTDIFGPWMQRAHQERMFDMMARANWHEYLVLTKRAQAMAEFACSRSPMPHVLLGVSIEDQRRANERRPHLLRVSQAGWRTWVSYEPALELVDWSGCEFINWMAVGGESDQPPLKARPFHLEWDRAALAWCRANKIPVFNKQLGSAPFLNGEPYRGAR